MIKDELGGREPLFDIISANMTQAEAFALEIELIAKHGREGIDEGGKLLNVATGGAGAPGVKASPEQIARLTAANYARWAAVSPEERSAFAKAGAKALWDSGHKPSLVTIEGRCFPSWS
jgi:hypothetical protein